MMGLPASSGRSRCSTEAKNASRSIWKMMGNYYPFLYERGVGSKDLTEYTFPLVGLKAKYALPASPLIQFLHDFRFHHKVDNYATLDGKSDGKLFLFGRKR